MATRGIPSRYEGRTTTVGRGQIGPDVVDRADEGDGPGCGRRRHLLLGHGVASDRARPGRRARSRPRRTAPRPAEEVGASLLTDQAAHHDHDGPVSRSGPAAPAPRTGPSRCRCRRSAACGSAGRCRGRGRRSSSSRLWTSTRRGPRAAPSLEAPAEDVGHPAVALEVERPVDGVDGRSCRPAGRPAGPRNDAIGVWVCTKSKRSAQK